MSFSTSSRRPASRAFPAQTQPETAKTPSAIETAQPEPANKTAVDETSNTNQTPVPPKANGPTPTQQQLQQDASIAASLKRAEAKVAAQTDVAAASTIPSRHDPEIVRAA